MVSNTEYTQYWAKLDKTETKHNCIIYGKCKTTTWILL